MNEEVREPSALSLDDLRSERERLRNEEDAVSFVRRLAQGRIDLVAAVARSRRTGETTSIVDIIRSGVGPAPSTGSARPPRDTDVAADHPLVLEFDELCDRLGFDDMVSLELDALDSLQQGLVAFESAQSARRRQLFDRIDSLTAELVRRYRDGGASVDSLLQG